MLNKINIAILLLFVSSYSKYYANPSNDLIETVLSVYKNYSENIEHTKVFNDTSMKIAAANIEFMINFNKNILNNQVITQFDLGELGIFYLFPIDIANKLNYLNNIINQIEKVDEQTSDILKLPNNERIKEKNYLRNLYKQKSRLSDEYKNNKYTTEIETNFQILKALSNIIKIYPDINSGNIDKAVLLIEKNIKDLIDQCINGINTDEDYLNLNYQFKMYMNVLNKLHNKYLVQSKFLITLKNDSLDTHENSEKAYWDYVFLKNDLSINYDTIREKIVEREQGVCERVREELNGQQSDKLFYEVYYGIDTIQYYRKNTGIFSLMLISYPLDKIYKKFTEIKNDDKRFDDDYEIDNNFISDLWVDTNRFCEKIKYQYK